MNHTIELVQPHTNMKWEKKWRSLEQQGNVGIEHVINPYLYPVIESALRSQHTPGVVVDCGAGTNSLGADVLLSPNTRTYIDQFIGIEASQQFVEQAAPQTDRLRLLNMKIASGHALPFQNSAVSLVVSRNFLMHLPIEDLSFHMEDAARILQTGGSYICSILNPEYEQRKWQSTGRPRLNENQPFKFAHGAYGELGMLNHVWKSQHMYEKIFSQYFNISKVTECRPLTDRFKKSHPRYYQPTVPMALVYELTVRT